ncbi:MAG: hypothetical protein LC637_14440 [Xanthomonadaceae bacterium]|nr:hypothetical protein [Xanthomonadaceae bacterium]
MKPPVLVEIGLIGTPDEPVRSALLPVLAELNQTDWPLVLLAIRPDRWKPTRNSVDKAFMGQAAIESSIHRAGGALDAIIYLDFGLFSRQRQRDWMFGDLADRYACRIDQMHAITRPGRIAESLVSKVGSIAVLENPLKLEQDLRAFMDGKPG